MTDDTTRGTFNELINHIRKLNDEHEIQTITVAFKPAKKPLIRLITNRPGGE